MSIPDFTGTVFELPPNLSYVTVELTNKETKGLPLCHRFFSTKKSRWKIKDAEAASKLRILQALAVRGHNHHKEKEFFRDELLCKRGHETKTCFENIMINTFELVSRCGLSFWKPVGWWSALFVVMMVIYGLFSNSFGGGNWFTDIGHLFNYTLANSLPLIGVFKSQDTVAVQALFGGAAGIPFWSGFWAGFHNLLSSIFLFFALLAIRNYFKLG